MFIFKTITIWEITLNGKSCKFGIDSYDATKALVLFKAEWDRYNPGKACNIDSIKYIEQIEVFE